MGKKIVERHFPSLSFFMDCCWYKYKHFSVLSSLSVKAPAVKEVDTVNFLVELKIS